MNYFYDAIIFGFLIIDAAFIFEFIRHWRAHFGGRAKKFNRFSAFLFAFAIISWPVIFYGSFIEPQFLAVKTQEIVLMDAADSAHMRIALASDFHVGPYKKADYLEKVVGKIMAEKPDLIVLDGDFVFDDAEQAEYLTPLQNLRAPLGVFAVLGNHDYKERVGASGDGYFNLRPKDEMRASAIRNVLESFDVKVLVNEGVKLHIGDKTLTLLGTDELWTGRASIEKTLESLGEQIVPHPSILISHNPDMAKKAQDAGIDLVLSGHTHGGQIRLPLIGSMSPLPDKLGRQYDKGLFRFGKTQLFISSGIGEIGARARLFDPPEIDVLAVKF